MSLASIWNIARRDIEIPKSAPTEICIEKHKEFILKYGRDRESYEYIMAEYLRMSGLYWCLASLDVLGAVDEADKQFIWNFVKENQNPDGVLLLQLVTIHISSTRSVPFRSFGDKLGEAVEFVIRCHNFDGGFGTRPGSESHAGQVYCCLGALAIAGCLELIDTDRTGEWLAERQCPSGGLCGRPENYQWFSDVCYSWWVLASLGIIKKLHWIDKNSLTKFILASQDDESGGIADRPEDAADPFHTVFGLSGLSLLDYPGLEPVDAVFCMTKKSLRKFSFI
uniref:Geranylgeranyl transferase type-2 subunit beta n=1 Tax=Ditylenchus dipsaci TaxID=166011 RepID=A0A915E360_9BILA